MFQRKVVEKIKTHKFVLTKILFQKTESFMRWCGKIQ